MSDPNFLIWKSSFPRKSNPRKLTWNLKIPPWKSRNIYKPPILGFHVSFGGCRVGMILTSGIEVSWVGPTSKTEQFQQNRFTFSDQEFSLRKRVNLFTIPFWRRLRTWSSQISKWWNGSTLIVQNAWKEHNPFFILKIGFPASTSSQSSFHNL